MVNEGTIRVRKWVKPYFRKEKGRTRRRKIRGHYITVFVNEVRGTAKANKE